MKRKFSIKEKLRARFGKQQVLNKDIHMLLQETITERKRILPQWERMFQLNTSAEKDIHSQLSETISRHKRIMKQWDHLFSGGSNSRLATQSKNAA